MNYNEKTNEKNRSPCGGQSKSREKRSKALQRDRCIIRMHISDVNYITYRTFCKTFFDMAKMTHLARECAAASLRRSIRPREQVPERPPCQVSEPPAPQVLGLVVQDVTALAQGREVRGIVARGVVVAVRRREDHAGRARALQEAVGGFRRRTHLPAPSRHRWASSSHQRPSTRCRTTRPCGRLQVSHRPWARRKRIEADSSRQSIG